MEDLKTPAAALSKFGAECVSDWCAETLSGSTTLRDHLWLPVADMRDDALTGNKAKTLIDLVFALWTDDFDEVFAELCQEEHQKKNDWGFPVAPLADGE